MSFEYEPPSGRDAIIALDIYFNHDWDKIFEAITSRDISIFTVPEDLITIETHKYSLIAEGYMFLVLIDEDYPQNIKHAYKPPFVIYHKCALEDVEKKFFDKSYAYKPKEGCFLDK